MAVATLARKETSRAPCAVMGGERQQAWKLPSTIRTSKRSFFASIGPLLAPLEPSPHYSSLT